MNHTTYSIGNLVLIEKADRQLDGYLKQLFAGIAGRAKDFVPLMKLFMYNRLGDCWPINHLTDHPRELFDQLGFENEPSERTIYRALERLGKRYALVLHKHQEVLIEHALATDKQFMDFSSTYFEGKAEHVGEYGYSRDSQPNKKQITFGITTGINGIPTALTIQKGNVQDKKHFRLLLRASEAVLGVNSLLIYDCGANTKKNKELVRKKGFHYLTLKAKKLGPYRTAIKTFQTSIKTEFELNGRQYQCVKQRLGDETQYIIFCEKTKQEQLLIKRQKYARELKKNKPLLKKTKKGKPLGKFYSEEGVIISKGILQQTFDDEFNPHIKGIEGFFILESSVDTIPRQILALYKDRDKAEKLIRNIKEGTELRPIRHWNKWTLIGHILIIFLTNFLVQLTLLRANSIVSTNVKRLKKKLAQLTLTVVYPPTGFKVSILSNESKEIQDFLGDSIERYRDGSLSLRW